MSTDIQQKAWEIYQEATDGNLTAKESWEEVDSRHKSIYIKMAENESQMRELFFGAINLHSIYERKEVSVDLIKDVIQDLISHAEDDCLNKGQETSDCRAIQRGLDVIRMFNNVKSTSYGEPINSM